MRSSLLFVEWKNGRLSSRHANIYSHIYALASFRADKGGAWKVPGPEGGPHAPPWSWKRARSQRRTTTPSGLRSFRLARWWRAGGSVASGPQSRGFRALPVTPVSRGGQASPGGGSGVGGGSGTPARLGGRPGSPESRTLRSARVWRHSPGTSPFWPPLPLGKPLSVHTLPPDE